MMPRYRLQGKCYITQYCHVEYPAKTGLPVLTKCSSREDCEGHEIIAVVDEIVEAIDAEDAIGNESLTQFEKIDDGSDGMEPTWCAGHPSVSEVK